MKTIVCANQKGGVGKSTLATHLASLALESGLRVLIVDLDAQGSMSTSFLPNAPDEQALCASHLFAETPPNLEPLVLSEHLSIIRADRALVDVDRLPAAAAARPAAALKGMADRYDVCVIDTPPLLGVRLMAGLGAADYSVTPVSVGMYELAGVSQLLQTIAAIRSQGLNPNLRNLGLLPVRVNSRSGSEVASLQLLRSKLGATLLDDVLPERAAVRQAIAARLPIWHRPRGEGAQKAAVEWRTACTNILTRAGVLQAPLATAA
jgi:chromosome partitioning protein